MLRSIAASKGQQVRKGASMTDLNQKQPSPTGAGDSTYPPNHSHEPAASLI